MSVAVQFLHLLPGVTLLCCTLAVLNHSGSGQFLRAAQWLLRICCCVLLLFGTCHARSSEVFNNVRRWFCGSGDGAVLQASYQANFCRVPPGACSEVVQLLGTGCRRCRGHQDGAGSRCLQGTGGREGRCPAQGSGHLPSGTATARLVTTASSHLSSCAYFPFCCRSQGAPVSLHRVQRESRSVMQIWTTNFKMK